MPPPLKPPPARAIQRVVKALELNSNDVGIGIVDTNTGRIHISPASITPDHPSLAELALGILHIDDASHLRGFTICVLGGKWIFANNSSLNPGANTMEVNLFEAIKAILEPRLGPCP